MQSQPVTEQNLSQSGVHHADSYFPETRFCNLHCLFCKAITCRMEWSRGDMFNTIKCCNCLNSPVKQTALSDTIFSGIPNWENTVLKCSIAVVANGELVHTASIHLECASKMSCLEMGLHNQCEYNSMGMKATPKDGLVQLVVLTDLLGILGSNELLALCLSPAWATTHTF